MPWSEQVASDQIRPERPSHRGPFSGLVGTAPAFQRTLALAARAAPTDVTVVLLGETGVGKEGIARAIHRASHRARGPFVAVNSGAIPRELIASELFGYAAGAFTGASPQGNRGKFEAAHGGTLFLDEVGELPPETQTYLLRVLQEKEIVRLGSHRAIPVDVRIIAATHRDLRRLVREGRFRADLYYRLSVVEIQVPPLRERPEDFPLLIAHFLSGFGRKGVTLGDGAWRELLAYPWPGNVRELMNVLQRAVVLGLDVEATLLAHVRQQSAAAAAFLPADLDGLAEADAIAVAVETAGGNVARAARELGVARSTIYRHLKAREIQFSRNLSLRRTPTPGAQHVSQYLRR